LNSHGYLPEWEVWIGLGAIIIVIVVFSIILKRKKILHEREKGLTRIYTDQRCGGQLGPGGTMVFSLPFVRVSVYEDFVVISTLFKIVLEISEIEKMVESRWSNTSMKLFHSNKKYANPLIISSRNLKELKEVIEAQMAKQRGVDESDGGKAVE